jgi:metallo-beta-lactamase family protein
MKLKFCGAARNVTGSCHLLTLDDGFNILLDCGLFQGYATDIWERNTKWHFDPVDIDVLILSHAHIDHSGRIPKLVKDGFDGKIYSTHATRSLCSIMLLDSAFIQERDVEYYNKRLARKKRNRRNKKRRYPLYKTKDVTPAMEKFVSLPYDRWQTIKPGLDIMFKDAGHILGSAGVVLRIDTWKGVKYLGFTGDIGRPDRPILRDPVQLPPVDWLICESTYGDREHETTPEQSKQFLQVIKETCLEKGGKLIIPAFSVGRTQEIVYMLDRMESSMILPKIKVYVDSPLAVNATEVFGAHPECYDNDLNEYLLHDDNPFGFKDLTYIRKVEMSKSLNDSNESCIIISSSGMMNAGRVKHHLANNIENPNNTILIVGYCTPETPGGKLRAGAETIRLFGEYKLVKARIKVMDSFSAHGDRIEMVNYLDNQKSAKKLFLVHGEIDTQSKFKSYLMDHGHHNVEIPKEGQVYKLE